MNGIIWLIVALTLFLALVIIAGVMLTLFTIIYAYKLVRLVFRKLMGDYQ